MLEEKKAKKSLNVHRKDLIKHSRYFALKSLKLANDYGIWTYAIIWLLTVIIGLIGYLILAPANIPFPGWDNLFSNPPFGFIQYFLPYVLQYINYFQNIVYSALQLFFLRPQTQKSIVENLSSLNMLVDLARWLGILIAFSTASVIMWNIFSSKINDWFLQTMEDHVIVCGTGRIGSRVAQEFGKKFPLVIIEKNDKAEALQRVKYSGALIVIGNAMDPEILVKAGIHKAKYLIPALGDDGANAEVAVQALELMKGRGGEPLTCLEHIVDPNLCHLLKVKEMDNENNSNMRLEFFSIYESGAVTILDDFEFFNPWSVEKQTPHMLVIGLGNMGESLVIQSAKRWWKYVYQKTQGKLTVTIVDKKAQKKINSLCLRYPSIQNCCNFHCFDFDVNEPEFLGGSFLLREQDKPQVNIAFVCLMDDSDGLSTALMLNHQFNMKDTPIVVRLNSDQGLALFLSNKGYTIEEFENVHAFGLWDRTCTYDLVSNGTHEAIARAIHEEYFLNQLNKGEKEGDRYTLVKWEKLGEEEKDNNRDPADHLNEKMKASLCGLSRRTDWEAELFTFTPEEIIRLSIIEHKRWCNFKKRYKWVLDRTLAKADSASHRHPYLIPWDELDAATKIKDIEAVVSLPTILSRVDMRIYRKDVQELIARAVYKRKNEKEKPEDRKSWHRLAEDHKKAFIDEAKLIKTSIDRCGYGVTGLVNKKSLKVDYDKEKLARSFYETTEEHKTPPGSISSVISWDYLPPELKSEYMDRVNEWPQAFAELDMKIYDQKKHLETYADDLKILEEFEKKRIHVQVAEGPRIKA